MNLEGLTTLSKNSSRGSGNEPFDLNHHADSNKFTVSEAIFATLDLNNNGLTAHLNTDEKQVFLSVENNENAVSYRGRSGSEKGRSFTSSEMSRVFTKYGLEGNLTLTLVGEKDEISYYRVDVLSEEQGKNEEVLATSEVSDEEVVDEEVVLDHSDLA